MHFRFIIVFFLLISSSISAFGAERHSSRSCGIGPLHKTYGGTPWLVYSCSDQKTLIVITATGSPAMPYVFTFYEKRGKYQLRGKGKGRPKLIKAAYKELHKFSHSQIQRMIAQTKKANMSAKRLHNKRLLLH